MTVTSSGSTTGASLPCLPSSIASVETVPASRASLWQEERRSRPAIPCSRSASCISQLSQGCSPPSTSKDGMHWGHEHQAGPRSLFAIPNMSVHRSVSPELLRLRLSVKVLTSEELGLDPANFLHTTSLLIYLFFYSGTLSL